jgi:hypothetical protein
MVRKHKVVRCREEGVEEGSTMGVGHSTAPLGVLSVEVPTSDELGSEGSKEGVEIVLGFVFISRTIHC